jgi:tetratricopeptide (TPR) repeat protein
VHGIEDVNRLRELGVTENVVLVAHGVIERPSLNMGAARSLLGLSDFSPVIGTFGFLLPGKGLPELIHSFALILRAHPAAYLLILNADYPTPESQEQRERCLALVGLLELEGHLRLINEFLDINETLFFLNACDAIVFPYQRSEESASGAVRLGLAAGRPVLTTPLPIFSELAEIVYQLPGTEAWEIAEGILGLLDDKGRQTEVMQRQRDWVRANSWAAQAARISNIIQGCFVETRCVELCVPRGLGSGLTSPVEGEAQAHGNSDLLDEDLGAAQRFLARRAPSWRDSATARLSSAENAYSLPSSTTRAGSLLQSTRNALAFIPGTGSWFISRADRARDSRNWVSAAQNYQKALNQKPDNSPIWVQYGHALKESGNLSEAENAYRKSLNIDPELADTHLQLGHLLKIQGRQIEASAAYLRALVLDPALDHATLELKGLGWTSGRIQLALRHERGEKH